MFFYEKWDVFKAAVRLREISHLLGDYQVRGTAGDLQQLRDNTGSVVLNISEGAKEPKKGKKLDRYGTALGSTGEANANLIVLQRLYPKEAQPLIAEGLELTNRIAPMVTNLLKSVERNWDKNKPSAPDPDSAPDPVN